MDRRKFIQIVGATGTFLRSSSLSYAKPSKTMTAKDVNSYLRSIIGVDEPSVDRIIIGDPNTEVKKIGTAWTPYWKTLKQAHESGVNVMIVHEPTFYTHWDLDAENSDFLGAPAPGRDNYMKARDEKKDWIEKSKMVVIRCHDVLDKIPGWGIPFSLGNALGFKNEDIVRSKTYYNVYKTEPKPAIDIAKSIAKKLKKVNQPGVAFYGNEDHIVKSIGLGTGCICDPLKYSELQPDMFIGIDDTIRTWIQTTYAEDTGKPLIVINHGTSEEFGVQSLSRHLQDTLDNIEVIHFDQGCSYKFVS
jgi:putative NIF3 family GTP cyclohydrolase 1 type 2